MASTAVDRAVEVMKLDLYDHAMGVIEGLEALQLLARANHNLRLESELDDMHTAMVRLSARIHKIKLDEAPTHNEYNIEVVEE